MSNKVEKSMMKPSEEKSWSFYLENYLLRRNYFVPILLFLIISLNIASLILSYNYTFFEVFSFTGIFIILLSINCNFFIYIQANHYYAFLASIITGIVPLIEISVHIANVPLEIGSIITSTIAIILSIVFIFSPFIILFFLKWRVEQE